MQLRTAALAIALTVGGVATTTACGGLAQTDRVPAAESAGSDATIAENPYIPEDANIGDCVSSLPRPDCGSEARGGFHELLTFGVLMMGMAFIGWRIFRSVRKRDRAAAAAAGRPPT